LYISIQTVVHSEPGFVGHPHWSDTC